VVYVGSTDGNLYALNASTGAKLWSDSPGGSPSSPAVANGVVYYHSGLGLYALNADTGATLGIYEDGGGFPPPVIVNGVVYTVGSIEGSSVYALSVGADLFLRV
jgi:outer membrane protein assembly factor BamB